MVNAAAVPFTAVTARVLWHGYEVGEMQNITVSENNNYRRIQAIGSGIEIRHVPGVYSGDVNAQRVYLEADLIVSLLNPIAEQYFPAGVQIARGRLIETSVTREQIAQAIVNGSGRVNIYDKVVNIYFDVQILNSADHVVVTLHDCSLNSRSWTMNIGSVLLMENCGILYRYKSYGNNPLGTEELAPALAGATPLGG